MKNRGICLGSFVFLGTIISLVAGCSLGIIPETGSPRVDKDGNYIITVNTAMAAKSIAAADAELYVKEYEIVCKEAGGSYYSGYAGEGESLTVSLPPGTYDMLLLAGDGHRVLLGTGWLPAEPIGPGTGSVTITVSPLTILESDMSFSDGGAPTAPSAGPPPSFTVSGTSTALTTAFTVKNTLALVNAGAAGGVTDIYTAGAGFADKKVVLEYYDKDHAGIIEWAPLDSGAISTPDITFTFDSIPINGADDWSALVYLKLDYIPFSQTSAPASSLKWSIRNGTGKKLSNGAVEVVAGSGGDTTNQSIQIGTN
jgi:hypothetical protein